MAEALRYRQKAARVRPDQEPVTARVPEPLMSQKTAHHTARVLAARAVAVRPRSLAGVRVLVVEDEPLMAEAIRDGLRLEAIAADVAGDGHTALELLSVNAYDIAVLDRDIPGPSGDEVAEMLISMPQRAQSIRCARALIGSAIDCANSNTAASNGTPNCASRSSRSGSPTTRCARKLHRSPPLCASRRCADVGARCT